MDDKNYPNLDDKDERDHSSEKIDDENLSYDNKRSISLLNPYDQESLKQAIFASPKEETKSKKEIKNTMTDS